MAHKPWKTYKWLHSGSVPYVLFSFYQNTVKYSHIFELIKAEEEHIIWVKSFNLTLYPDRDKFLWLLMPEALSHAALLVENTKLNLKGIFTRLSFIHLGLSFRFTPEKQKCKERKYLGLSQAIELFDISTRDGL